MLILHLPSPDDWARYRADGAYAPPSVAELGFVHGCRRHWATIVANSILRSEERLAVVAIDSRRLGVTISWDGPPEQPRLWPNVAGPLPLDAVVEVVEWSRDGDRFPRLPASIRTLDCGEDEGLPWLAAGDVARLLTAIEEAGVDVVVEGGWAVDALVGDSVRRHGDLDIAIDTSQLARLDGCVRRLGLRLVVDERPVRIVFGDDRGRRLDVHPRDLSSHWYAGVTTTGTIAGRVVRCLVARRQIEQHTGYEPGEHDYVDLERLRSLGEPAS